MKKVFLAGIIFLIIFLIICFNSNLGIEKIYNDVLSNKYSILENGVKIQYFTSNNLLKEKNRIIKTLNLDKKQIQENLNSSNSFYINSINNNNFIINGSKKDNLTFIEIEVTEMNDVISINKLQKKLEKLENKDVINKQYFTYIKAKFDKVSNLQNETLDIKNILQKYGLNEFESINLESGITSIVELKNKLQINYSVCNYEHNTYLVIGTPVIFITY